MDSETPEGWGIAYVDEGAVLQHLGSWTAEYTLGHGPLRITQITIRPQSARNLRRSSRQPGPITARALRQIKPGLALDVARQALRAKGEDLDDWLGPRAAEILDEFERQERRQRRRGVGWPALAATAARYVAAVAGGDRRPVQTVAAALELRPEQVRDRLAAARRAGLLTRSAPNNVAGTSKGIAGGELTAEARALLAGEVAG